MTARSYRLQFGRNALMCGAATDPYNRSKASLTSLGVIPKQPTAAERFEAWRKRKLAADQSVDTFMRRGETTTRFAYFSE